MSLEGEEERALQMRNTVWKVSTGVVNTTSNGKRNLAEHSQHHGLPEIPGCAQIQCMGLNVLGFGRKGECSAFLKKYILLFYCQSMFFTQLLVRLYFLTCERFSSKNFFPNLWKARFSHTGKCNFMEWCIRTASFGAGSSVDQCNTKDQFTSCFHAILTLSLRGSSESQTFTWSLKFSVPPPAPSLPYCTQSIAICRTTRWIVQLESAEDVTLGSTRFSAGIWLPACPCEFPL